MDRLNFVQVTLEDRQSQDSRSEAVKSTVPTQFISAIVENRYSGSGKGTVLLFQDGKSMRVQDSFEELNNRLPHRLLLKQVAPAGRDTLRISIHPEQIRLIEGTRYDGRGTPEGSRVSFQNSEKFQNQIAPIYVTESVSEITERLATLSEQWRSQKTKAY